MPHADTQIFMPAEGYVEDSQSVLDLGGQISVRKGRLAVLMDPTPETFAGSTILAPGGMHTGKYRPDSGTVIDSGYEDVKVGDRVIVQPYAGLWLKQKDLQGVPAKWGSCEYAPVGSNIIMRVDGAKDKTEGGVYLPDAVKNPPQMGVVIKCGPEVKTEEDRVGVMPHDRVIVSKNGGHALKDSAGQEWHCCPESNVFAIVGPEFSIPAGREVRFYGVQDDVWRHVVAVIS